jgi:hypothetical protein
MDPSNHYDESAARHRHQPVASGRLKFLAPGIGVDVDDVTVLGKAVDECDDAGGACEDLAGIVRRMAPSC